MMDNSNGKETARIQSPPENQIAYDARDVLGTGSQEESADPQGPAGMAKLSIGKRLIKTRQGRLAILVLSGILVFGFMLLRSSKSDRKKASGSSQEASEGGPGFDDTLTTAGELRSLYASYGDRLSGTESGITTLKENSNDVRQDVEGIRKILADLLRSRDDRQRKLDRIMKALEGVIDPSGGDKKKNPDSQSHAGGTTSGITLLSFSSPGDQKRTRRALTIPAASAGLATVMAGVFAPVSGEPAPIRLRLDAALLGPNRSRVGIQNAYLIGKARGDANSSRVTIELVTLSYVTKDGRTVSLNIQGYVEGNDGYEGLPGSYHYRASESIPLSGITSALTGAADALARRETTRSINALGTVTDTLTGDPLRYAGLSGLSGSSKKFEEIMAERIREFRPAVHTPPGQSVRVVFLRELVIDAVDAEEITNFDERNPYAGLDLHR